jgi:hypothetical protein
MTPWDETNPDWEPPTDLPGWEPWMDDEPEPAGVGCEYCPNLEVRDLPEPFGGKRCCDACFALLIGD